MPKVDDDQLAALRRLRAIFGFGEVEVIGHDSDDDPIGPPGEPIEGGSWRIRDG